MFSIGDMDNTENKSGEAIVTSAAAEDNTCGEFSTENSTRTNCDSSVQKRSCDTVPHESAILEKLAIEGLCSRLVRSVIFVVICFNYTLQTNQHNFFLILHDQFWNTISIQIGHDGPINFSQPKIMGSLFTDNLSDIIESTLFIVVSVISNFPPNMLRPYLNNLDFAIGSHLSHG